MAVEMMGTSLVPMPAIVAGIERETPDIITLTLEWRDSGAAQVFACRPGQFVELSVFGSGESTFAVSSLPDARGRLGVSVKRVGSNTRAVHSLRRGDLVGLRGPYGNSFPYEDWRGRDLLIVGGGIGLAPLRPLIESVLTDRGAYGRLTILYGARTPGDLMYRRDLERWRQAPDTEVVETIDAPAGGWSGRVGFVPAVLEEMHPSPEGRVAVTCGPPIMIKFVVQTLQKLGFAGERIFTTLEMKMKCGLGKCGRCNIGGKYVCKDGPVFTWAELGRLPEEY